MSTPRAVTESVMARSIRGLCSPGSASLSARVVRACIRWATTPSSFGAHIQSTSGSRKSAPLFATTVLIAATIASPRVGFADALDRDRPVVRVYPAGVRFDLANGALLDPAPDDLVRGASVLELRDRPLRFRAL